ncbi:MAG: NADH-quinone oxidoreductase subunit G [Pirellulaceae bacterium]
MGTVIVDGREIELREGERINGIEAAARAGIEIPHYCWHPGLSVVASCRMCLVETGRRDPATGEVSMLGKLVPACQTPATGDTVFVTDSPKVIQARAMVEEDLLLRHPVDCPICDKSGECRLQDYFYQHGQSERRADIKPFTSRRRALGDTVTLFVDRCVMCSRCVRFCREVTQSNELMIINRGAHEEIDVFPGFPLDNPLSGNVVDLCPVGALGDKDFLYSQRVWFMQEHPHVCGNCATGCSIYVDENQDRIYRLRPRENPHVNQWWICDEGRYGWKHTFDPHRWVEPRTRRAGKRAAVDWEEAIREVDAAVRRATRLAVVLSPHLTVEEAYMMAAYARQVQPAAALIPGPVPTRGQDQSFSGGFTIRAEKCPNRRGVEQVISALVDRWVTWDEWLIEQATNKTFDAVWIMGGYKSLWNDPTMVAQFDGTPLLIVQDLFASPLGERADWQLPATAFPERSGSFVNGQDRLQTFEWAIRPPRGVMGEGHLLWRLLGRAGLYNASQVLREVAEEIDYFSAALAPVPAVGVDLKLKHLAQNTGLS